MLRPLVLAACCLFSLAASAAEQTPPAQPQGQPQGPQISAQVVKPLRAAQDAILKDSWEEALGHLAEAQAIEGRTTADNYQIQEFLGYIYVKKGDYPEAAKAFEAALQTGLVPAEKVPERVRILAQLNFQAKNYPKAIEFGNRWHQSPGDKETEVNVLLGQSQYLTGDYRSAVKSMQAAIESATKAGKPVTESWLQIQLSSYVQLQDQAGVTATLQQLAVGFPKKSYWEDLLNMMQRQKGVDERTQLNILRLSFETGLMKNADDFFQMAQIASRLGVPGEAVRALEQGSTKKVFTSEVDVEKCRQMLQEVKAAASADRRTLTALEKEARASKSGEPDVQLGIAFISYDQYDSGVEAIKRGLAKGKLKNADEAAIMLGKALLKLNRNEDAKAAFQRVDNAAKLGAIAALWVVYSQQPAFLAS